MLLSLFQALCALVFLVWSRDLNEAADGHDFNSWLAAAVWVWTGLAAVSYPLSALWRVGTLLAQLEVQP